MKRFTPSKRRSQQPFNILRLSLFFSQISIPPLLKGELSIMLKNFNDEVFIFEVLKHPYQAHNVLLSSSGEILLADYTDIIET